MPPARASGDEIRRLVTCQLGRTPSIPFRIEVSCAYGFPAVIRSSPFDARGRPNPNLYYLSCPYLRKLLARLEDSGFIGTLQNRAGKNHEIAVRLASAQNNHMREWRDEAGGSIGTTTEGPRIAAASDDLSIKCLHAHFAYFLVHPDYIIGKMIIDEIEKIWCSDQRCRSMMREIYGGV